jgi:hypothetical protein
MSTMPLAPGCSKGQGQCEGNPWECSASEPSLYGLRRKTDAAAQMGVPREEWS